MQLCGNIKLTFWMTIPLFGVPALHESFDLAHGRDVLHHGHDRRGRDSRGVIGRGRGSATGAGGKAALGIACLEHVN